MVLGQPELPAEQVEGMELLCTPVAHVQCLLSMVPQDFIVPSESQKHEQTVAANSRWGFQRTGR